jgi:hypothetical protein
MINSLVGQDIDWFIRDGYNNIAMFASGEALSHFLSKKMLVCILNYQSL